MRVVRRPESTSIPTDSMTAEISAADGEVLPPMVSKRYAARYFILADFCSKLVSRRSQKAGAREVQLSFRKMVVVL